MKRRAIVTGGARGIGRACGAALAAADYDVALWDIDGAAVNAGAAALQERYPHVRVRGRACDVGRGSEVEAAGAEAGEVDVVVNNAGVGGPFHRVDEVSDAEWDSLFCSNVRSVFHTARRFLPSMRARGFGRIINIASIQGFVGASRSSTYVATKHAMLGYTRSLAHEWGAFGITSNALCPGYVATAMGAQDDAVADHTRKIVRRTPVGRMAQPDEIARWVVFLASDASGYVNGSVIALDGGISATLGID